MDVQTPNFAAAWVYNYSNGTGTLPHGDVHRLSDGSYSVLRMPGGTNMELIRFSPEGIPLGTKAFKVPQTYAGCPFMPSEETFIDDSSILSYGGSVFRVDLLKGEVMWEAQFSGQLEHSTRGFWVVERQSNGAARIRPLDIVSGALEPGLAMPAAVAGGAPREYIGVRVIYDRNEGTDRAFRGDEATPATRRYVVAHLEARGAASGTSSASRLVLEAFRDGDVTPRWTFNHDFVRANYGRPNYAVVDGQLLAAAGNDLLSVDLSTGELSWTYGLKRAGGTSQTPYGFSDVPMNVSADGTEVRFWDLDGVYHRLATATGEEFGRVQRHHRRRPRHRRAHRRGLPAYRGSQQRGGPLRRSRRQ